MDVAKLASLWHQRRGSLDDKFFDVIKQEALRLQGEIIRSLKATENQIDAEEAKIRDRWGKDPNFLQSSECRDAMASSSSKVNTHTNMCVQRAAMQGIVEACQQKDAKGIEQFVGFAENPRQTLIQLPDMVEKEKPGARTWHLWTGIVVAAILGKWLNS